MGVTESGGTAEYGDSGMCGSLLVGVMVNEGCSAWGCHAWGLQSVRVAERGVMVHRNCRAWGLLRVAYCRGCIAWRLQKVRSADWELRVVKDAVCIGLIFI